MEISQRSSLSSEIHSIATENDIYNDAPMVAVSGCNMRNPSGKCHHVGTVFFIGMAALGLFAITAGTLSRFNVKPLSQWGVKIAEKLQITKSPIDFGTIAAGVTLVGFGIFSIAQVQHSRKAISNEQKLPLKGRIATHKAKTAAAIACWAIAAAALSVIAVSLIPKNPIGAFFRTYPGAWIPAWAAASFSSLAAMALSCHVLRDKPPANDLV